MPVFQPDSGKHFADDVKSTADLNALGENEQQADYYERLVAEASQESCS